MIGVEVRESQKQDVNPLFELVQELRPLTQHTPYTYWNLLNNFGNSCFIAIDNEQPIGFITSHPTTNPASEWFIWQAGILPDYRGQGLIDELQDKVIEVAKDYGAVAMRTSIKVDNPRSLGAFTRMATRLGAPMEEIDRIMLAAEDEWSAPEVLYRIPL